MSYQRYNVLFVYLIIAVLICYHSLSIVKFYRSFAYSNNKSILPKQTHSYETNSSISIYQTLEVHHNLLNSVSENNCHLPKLDAFGADTQKFFRKWPKPVNCAKNFKPYKLLFSIDKNTLVKTGSKKEFANLSCCYQYFIPSKKIRVPPCVKISEEKTALAADAEFLQIYCNSTLLLQSPPTGKKRSKNIPIKQIPADMFHLIQTKENVEHRVRKKLKPSAETLNVVIFGIDSVSHPHFQRSAPATVKFLREKMSALYLNGYSSVGSSTFPNAVALLTGKREIELKSTCWPKSSAYLDPCPFIWKEFEKYGYQTSYAEDMVHIGIFQYGKAGFKKPPTDYYLNDYMRHASRKIGHDGVCYGPRLSFSILLENMKSMAVLMGVQKRYFQFTWATGLTHDHFRHLRTVDLELKRTLQFLLQEGYLSQTVLLLTSDHGFRWGDFRGTSQGRLEQNMPFLYAVFPKWFREKYPLAITNFKWNKNKLTTPFDIYQLLKDLLHLQQLENSVLHIRQTQLNTLPESKLPRGISPFIAIPATRSCKSAGIPDSVCNCNFLNSISTKNLLVASATQAAIEFINKQLSKFAQCAKLKMSRIISAYKVQLAGNFTVTKTILEYKVTFQTLPGKAIFEATMKIQLGNNMDDSDWTPSGKINRLNKYGEQSRCIGNYEMKSYCFCN